MKKISYILLSLGFCCLFSCQNKSENDKVLAKVGSFKITEKYFNEKLKEINQKNNRFLNLKSGKKQFLDMLINERIVKILSENSNIRNSREYKEQVDTMRKEMEEKIKEFKEYLLTRMWLEDLKRKELNITEKDIQEYFSKYPKVVTIEHIIADSYEAAEKAMKEMKQGVPTSRILKENEDMTGGKLSPILPGEFLPEFEDMFYKMKIGEIQGVIKSKLGFHVIKKIAENNLDFNKEETKERIRRILEKKKFDEYIAKVQKKYKVEVLDEDYK